jgi:hypothetical protein
LNFASREPSTPKLASRTVPLSPQLRQLLQQQQQLLAELDGERPETITPKPSAPQPRSQRRREFMEV